MRYKVVSRNLSKLYIFNSVNKEEVEKDVCSCETVFKL